MSSRHLSSERGQSLVLFAAVLLGLIAMVGLVIDGANAFAGRRQVQNAADAAALAAVREVGPALDPACDSACMTGVRTGVASVAATYSGLNGGKGTLAECAAPSDRNCYTWPYGGSNGKVEVRLQNAVSGFFTKLLGLGTDFFRPSSRAVAALSGVSETQCWLGGVRRDDLLPSCSETTTTGGSPALMFAYCGYPGDPCSSSSNACDAMHISGTGNTFYGAIVSNGGVNESGSNFGNPPNGNAILYYGTTDVPKCLTWKPSWAVEPPVYQAPIPWPVPPPTLTCSGGSTGLSCPSGEWVTKVDGVNCTKLPDDKFTVNSATDPSGVAWSGLYCATSKITINKTGITVLDSGFIAPEITWSSGNNRLTGYSGLYNQYGGLLFDAYGSSGLNWSGSNDSWQGAIFAPFGNAQVSGGGVKGTCGGVSADACGFIEGLTVQVSGGGGTWAGLGPSIGSSTTTVTGEKKVVVTGDQISMDE